MYNVLSPPVGSDFYYALRFSGQAPAPLSLLWEFVQTIQAIRTPLLDESVVPVKLKWWHEEIHRTFVAAPEHPLTVKLFPLIQTAQFAQADFLNIIDMQLQAQSQPEFPTWDHFKAYAHLNTGSELYLYSKLLAYPNSVPTAFVQNLSVALCLIEKIVNFGQDLKNGMLFFPQSDLDFFKINPTQLFNKQCHPATLSSLLLRQANRARQAYQLALAALPLNDRLSQLPLLILAELKIHLLNEIEREHFNVLEHTYRLTPLRQCWIAWRCYRTEKRRSQHGTRYLKTRTT